MYLAGRPADHHRPTVEAALQPALPGLYRLQLGVRTACAGHLSEVCRPIGMIPNNRAFAFTAWGFINEQDAKVTVAYELRATASAHKAGNRPRQT